MSRPIIFSGPMVRAILERRKTQTRRVVKPWGGTLFKARPEGHLCGSHSVRSPYGVPGDRLWVRETWGAPDCDPPGLPEGRRPTLGDRIDYRSNPADDWQWSRAPNFVWRPSIHMPRWASRIDLEVAGVRVDRLQEITDEDARAEGIPQTAGEAHAAGLFNCSKHPGHEWDNRRSSENFAHLWDSINAKRAPWSSDPWVWVVEFRRVVKP